MRMNHPDEPEEKALDGVVRLRVRNGLQNAAEKTDEAADERGDGRQRNGASHAPEIGGTVLGPQFDDVGAQLRPDHARHAPFKYVLSGVQAAGKHGFHSICGKTN
jgi:hypothetical protein